LKKAEYFADSKTEVDMRFLENGEIFRTVLDSLSMGVYLVDCDRKIVFWNRGAEKISGYLSQDLLGRVYRDKLLIQYDEEHEGKIAQACQLTEALRDGEMKEADVFLLHKEGHRVPVRVCAVPLRDDKGKIVGAAESFEELRFPTIRGHRPVDAAIPFIMNSVTGLPDLSSTRVKINRAISELKEHQVPFCLLSVDVDGMDKLQAKSGKAPVECARKVMAHTVTAALRPDDFVGCDDSNRFIAILRYCEKQGINRVGDRIRTMAHCSEVDWWGDALELTVSIGGTVARCDDNADTLIERARRAMEQSLTSGGDKVTVGETEIASEV
jgi:PAS domain S-box-containing protein/diguanylate cyclase (GGDEF)-like protein